MIKNLQYIILLVLTTNLSIGQDCKNDYLSASLDTNYYRNTVGIITKEIGNCTTNNIHWDEDCNSPRSVTFKFEIKLSCNGKIISAEIVDSEFEYFNSNGEKIKIKADQEIFRTVKDCIETELSRIKSLKPLIIEEEFQNTEIKSGFKISNI